MTFDVQAQGMDICYDPATDQQFLNFQFAMSASLPQLLKQLLEWQQRDMQNHSQQQQQQQAHAQQHAIPPQQLQGGCGAGAVVPLGGGQANSM
eukprot:CAMPEP_0170276728 /NCGR_PEP_ID=MMETSP0116_2-20130129/38350_1 /TAXON_ID=400756 /ORGANISM="Durinskia baltica, Strain CSIRO CS-38" /LENGTH=92 /DNA_ID=CAMNT_0010528003 /DNA_START=22 /DNA_END=297 /DNA_ORIENTATION=-